VFDLRDDDVFWCTADVGWVTGHSYVAYGPLAAGATMIHLRGCADLSGWRALLEDVRGAPREHLLHRADRDPRADEARRCDSGQYDLSRLRLLGSVGEPINPRHGCGISA
jgi:acetyl-CoA synthetase